MLARKKVLVVCGTRPEGIKLAPLINALNQAEEIESFLCTTGQHREMLYQVFDLFDLKPDYDLDIMRDGQSLADVTTAILVGLEPILEKLRPDCVIVHGDTNTTLSTSLASFYAQIPILHVEAGLRTGDLNSPWPEEANRRITGVLAQRHYAPTVKAKQNLLAEKVPDDSILVTGNTVIDALQSVVRKLDNNPALESSISAELPQLDPKRKLILVTGHRRENFGSGFESLFTALNTLAKRDDVQIVFPVHLNPKVQEPVHRLMGDNRNIQLIEPLQYLPFVYLMKRAYLIISDSGGVQEEAPGLGVPVLVTRENTERPEALEAGTVVLVGIDSEKILNTAQTLLDDPQAHSRMSKAENPYGDGKACKRIIRDLLENEL